MNLSPALLYNTEFFNRSFLTNGQAVFALHFAAHLPLLHISPQEQSLFTPHRVIQKPDSRSQGQVPSHLETGLAQFIKGLPTNPTGQAQLTLWPEILHSAQVPQTEVTLQGSAKHLLST